MHEFVEDLEGVEVIADDFLIAGFGTSADEIHKSLEKNKRAFLEKCLLWNLKLNRAKERRGQSSVKFRGPETGSGEDLSYLADARTGRRYSTKPISGNGDLPSKLYAPPVRDGRTSEAIGGQ